MCGHDMRKTPSVDVLVLQFDADKGLGLLDRPLLASGCALDVRLGERAPDALGAFGGLILLGGLADPDGDDPAIIAACAIASEALARDVPTLGVCLGAEVLVRAAGGEIPRIEPEFGFKQVALEPGAAADPLLAGLPPRFRVFQAHGFGCRPPAGSPILARSPSGIQAFRIGPVAWGVQFHLEPDAAMVESWVTSAPVRAALAEAGVDGAQIVRDAARFTPDWAGWTAEVAGRFAAVVRDAA